MFTSAQLMHDTAMTTAVVTGDVEAVKKLCRWVGKFAASPIFRHLISWLRLVPPPLKLGLFSSGTRTVTMQMLLDLFKPGAGRATILQFLS